MRVMFLGTAAAEGVPAVFCNCPTCLNAKAKGGKDVRTRSQILIDDDTLFDFPMDTYMHMLRYNLDLSKVARVFITHSHMDHCYPQEFCMRGGPFAKNMTADKVEVYGNSKVCQMFKSDTSREMRPEVEVGIGVNVLRPYDEVTSGDMRIIALPASHTVGEECLVYYLERGGKGVLLLNDTGVLDYEVYNRLAKMGANVRLVALDCTYGALRHGAGRHMGLYDIVDQKSVMAQAGVITDDTVVIATHLSHNTDLDYDGISALAAEYGITVAYDGMIVDI
ncbi:MAG: MBL fold metallo-hydrolase [Clostridiales bacterium]|nr:MBL fold metallo-hydrolase [Clostridiales bacterium]